jgi:pilus assembly protein Flp/PilA
MSNFISAVKAFAADENGVTAIEYGLIAALVGVGIMVAANALGGNLSTLFGKIGNKLANVVVP